MCEILYEKARLAPEALLIERVQDGVAGTVGRGAGAICHITLGIVSRVPAEFALIDRAGLGTAEWHPVMLEFDDRRDRLTTHAAILFDRVLIADQSEPLTVKHAFTSANRLFPPPCFRARRW